MFIKCHQLDAEVSLDNVHGIVQGMEHEGSLSLTLALVLGFVRKGIRACCRSASQLQYRESIDFVAVREAGIHPRQLCQGIGGYSGDICADESTAQAGSSRVMPRYRSC